MFPYYKEHYNKLNNKNGLKLKNVGKMSKEELIQFLKENLRVELSTEECWETTEVCAKLYLGDEQISDSYVTI